MTTYFGTRWDAPLVDDATQVSTPVGQPCQMCTSPIADGDRGLLMGCVRLVDGEQVGSVEPVHTECLLLDTVGHSFGVCGCTGAGRTRADGLRLLEVLNADRAARGCRSL